LLRKEVRKNANTFKYFLEYVPPHLRDRNGAATQVQQIPTQVFNQTAPPANGNAAPFHGQSKLSCFLLN